MPNHPKTIAIIPARGGSKRFPGKNLAPLAGKPLLAYTIESAIASGMFTTICVSSDHDAILAVAEQYGAEPLRRPNELADDRTPIADACIHALEEYEQKGFQYDALALLQATCPLRTAEDIRTAFDLLQSSKADAILSVSPFTHPPQRAMRIANGILEPFSSEKEVASQGQDLEPLYISDGAIDIIRTDIFRRERTFFVKNSAPYVLPECRAVDIDEPVHLAWAEFLLLR